MVQRCKIQFYIYIETGNRFYGIGKRFVFLSHRKWFFNFEGYKKQEKAIVKKYFISLKYLAFQ